MKKKTYINKSNEAMDQPCVESYTTEQYKALSKQHRGRLVPIGKFKAHPVTYMKTDYRGLPIVNTF